MWEMIVWTPGMPVPIWLATVRRSYQMECGLTGAAAAGSQLSVKGRLKEKVASVPRPSMGGEAWYTLPSGVGE